MKVKGTLAIVILAKKRKLVPAAADLIRSLRAAGFRLDEQLVRQVLARTVDEDWIP